MSIDLRESWRIRDVEIPTRLVLAPMAGVSVQAFRRQGRRFGAGLVCSEMVSCAGIEHRNERTLGYLRVAGDEHPLAIQIFGSEPRAMAEAARMVEAAGADLVDINFGCPVRKVTKTGAGATLLDEPARAAAIVEAVANAVDVPVSVKMRRGLRDGARTCLEVGPQLVDAGAATLTLHPRSAQQMYTGTADHALTAELVSLVERAGDRVGRHHLPRQGAGGAGDDRRRRGHGRPRRAGQPVDPARDRRRRRSRADTRGGRRRARSLHPRDRARARRAASLGLPEEVLRLVSRPRPLPAAVQAGARRARLDRGGRAPADRRGAGSPDLCSSGWKPSCRAATRCCSTCRSRSTAAAEGQVPRGTSSSVQPRRSAALRA